MLQVQRAAGIGWLLYSTRDMNFQLLLEEIKYILEIDVGIIWKVISLGVCGIIPGEQQVQALHFEVHTNIKMKESNPST